VVEQKEFKDALIEFYAREGFCRNQVRCMITNEWHSRNDVIAARIWMIKTREQGLAKFHLEFHDLVSPRNGFLALKSIEEKFDRKQLCFLYHPLEGNGFTVKVLDPSILNTVIDKSKGKLTFGAIDGKRLCHPPGKFPYRRLLGSHARSCYVNARNRGWILDNENFEEYFHLSETASAPDS
jgi:hypothetical protein